MTQHVELLVIELPASLVEWFGICAQRQGLTSDKAMTLVLEGLPGLEKDDLASFAEPSRREPRCTSRFHISNTAVRVLNEISRGSGLGRAQICCRVMYGILVTHQIKAIWDPNSGQFLLQRAQLRFDFAKEI
jgi:hypothetical protein